METQAVKPRLSKYSFYIILINKSSSKDMLRGPESSSYFSIITLLFHVINNMQHPHVGLLRNE